MLTIRRPLRVAVLCSRRAPGLTHVLATARGQARAYDVVCVVTTEAECGDLRGAAEAGVPALTHDIRAFYAARQARVQVDVIARVDVAHLAERARLLDDEEGRDGREGRVEVNEAADLLARVGQREAAVGRGAARRRHAELVVRRGRTRRVLARDEVAEGVVRELEVERDARQDFVLHYGPGSFVAHLEEANLRGLPHRVLHDDNLALDLDTADDLKELDRRTNDSMLADQRIEKTAASRISRARYDRLAEAIREILAAAIVQGGSTLRDFIAVNGQSGYFQQTYFVYDRAGVPCRNCGAPVRQIVQGQRSTFYCATCQK